MQLFKLEGSFIPFRPVTPKNRNLVVLLFSIFFLLTAIASSEAADTKFFRFTNNTGGPVSDLHVTFRNTGGSLTTVVTRNAPGCPAPAIPSNGTSTNTMVLDWGVNCLANGASVTVQLSTINGPLAIDNGSWTNVANPKPPGVGPVNMKGDVEEVEKDEADDPGTPGDDGDRDEDFDDDMIKWILSIIILLLLLLLYYFWKKLKEQKPANVGNGDQDGGNGGDGPLGPFDETIIELESKAALLARLKRGRTPAQQKLIDQAIAKIREAIDGLKKMRDGDPDAPSEGDIEKALRDAADLVDQANPGNRSAALRRVAECLRDIARNLF